MDMYVKLTTEQKAEINADKYNELKRIHDLLSIKLATVRLQQAYIDTVNTTVEIFDESLPDDEYVKKAENIVNLYKLLKSDAKELLLDKEKTQRIVAKYGELKAKEEQTEKTKDKKKEMMIKNSIILSSRFLIVFDTLHKGVDFNKSPSTSITSS